VIFTSDNGGYIHYNHEFKNISSNGPLRGQKAEVYEGGHRVPFIARWPGKIDSGIESSEITMTMDLYPTFAKMAGAELSDNQLMDGMNLSSLLFEEEKIPERAVFWKMDDEIAIRQEQWKLVKIGDQPYELYNLEQDICEKQDQVMEQAEIAKELWARYLDWEEEINRSSKKWEQ
jgi:arylsulfatase A